MATTTKRVWCIVDTTPPKLSGMVHIAVLRCWRTQYVLGLDVHGQRAEYRTEAGADAALARIQKINPTGAKCLRVLARYDRSA